MRSTRIIGLSLVELHRTWTRPITWARLIRNNNAQYFEANLLRTQSVSSIRRTLVTDSRFHSDPQALTRQICSSRVVLIQEQLLLHRRPPRSQLHTQFTKQVLLQRFSTTATPRSIRLQRQTRLSKTSARHATISSLAAFKSGSEPI